jgi:serine/threonine protein kinase
MPSISDKTFAQYQVGREVGRGAMGTVYIANDPVAKVRMPVPHRRIRTPTHTLVVGAVLSIVMRSPTCSCASASLSLPLAFSWKHPCHRRSLARIEQDILPRLSIHRPIHSTFYPHLHLCINSSVVTATLPPLIRHCFQISVAIKAMKKKKHSRRALLHEVAVMKNLAHENVVQMVTVMESKQELFIVLEYVGGGELFDKVSRALRPIDPIPSTLESNTQTLYDTGAACHALDAKLENLKHGVAGLSAL